GYYLFISSRLHMISNRYWSSDVCSSDLHLLCLVGPSFHKLPCLFRIRWQMKVLFDSSNNLYPFLDILFLHMCRIHVCNLFYVIFVGSTMLIVMELYYEIYVSY